MKRWTARLAVARSKRNIAGAIERLRAVSIEWSEVDHGYEREAENLIVDLDRFAKQIEAETAERLAAGEYVGL